MNTSDHWEEAVQRCITRGDYHQALDLLVQACQDWLVRTCAHLLADPDGAEDLAQEVFLTAYQAMSTFRGEASALRPWLYGIARHKCQQARRKAWRRRILFQTQQARIAEAVQRISEVPSAHVQRQQSCVRKVWQRLRLRDREVLLLYYIDNHTITEIAARKNVAPKTITRWRKKAVCIFNRALERCMRDGASAI